MIKLLLLLNLTTMGMFELPKLPYGLDALEPQISKETMEYHYGKHHKAYVDKLNELTKGTKYEGMNLEGIMLESEGPVFNNAAQVWNHTFFFYGLSPQPKTRPAGKLAESIDKYFGSLEKLKEEMTQKGVGQFGSGWVWLIKEPDGRLAVVATPNAGNPITSGMKPLMCIDVWEHAYYIDYRNRRPDFINAAWEKTDWAVIEKRFAE